MGLTPPRDLLAELKLSPQLLADLRVWRRRAKEKAEEREAKERAKEGSE